ncbi:MAG: helix-turn-helix domain-containing protein, partial [Chloroflexota bacterium]|nr:helix-turn-helix domain-containing protein [Chloroflexota bacterium]
MGSLGVLLRQQRLAASLSQASLAQRAGLTRTTVAALERGARAAPRPATVLRLIDALGVVPPKRTALIAAADAARLSRRADPQPISSTTPASLRMGLPASLSSFVGRDSAIVELHQLLRQHRLLTLVGVAGIGKTRLALEVARAAVDAFADGASFVEFASLSDGALVVAKVAATLGLVEHPSRPVLDVLIEQLQPRRALLVLDNCEHLVQPCAELVDALVRACPDLRVLATSREQLGLPGERVWRVPPLSLAPPDATAPERTRPLSEAVRLFVDRTGGVHGGLVLTLQTTRLVEQVCCRLDGIPLAIELAAAHLGVIGLDELEARLDRCLRLLTRGSRVGANHQRTLRGTIEWSYGLLSPQERAVFERVSVFAGGWTLAGAEQVGGGGVVDETAVLGFHSGLVDKSLVVAEPHAGGASMRYGMPEVLRQFAAERLASGPDAAATRARHARHVLALAEAAEVAL